MKINNRITFFFVLGSLLLSNNVYSKNWLSAPKNKDFYDNGMPDEKKVKLGEFLFFDKILSGNQNISCASCHHTLTDTGDGLSLPVGEGGQGLGVTRNTGTFNHAIHSRVPRNAPPVFNLGARQFTRMFYDGRVETNPEHPSGFSSPAGDDLPGGLDNVLAAQAMFPVTSAEEMAGQTGENQQADAAAAGDLPAVWEHIASKLRNIPEYVELFKTAYPLEILQASDISYVHAANAIAAFEAKAWRFDNSPFHRFLRGERHAMSRSAKFGMRLFYSKKKLHCARCHSGAFQTDHDFHAIAMPQIGPGKGDNLDGFSDGHDDFGRATITGNTEDRFSFRTPTLSNIALTAPYGHDGAYNTLEAVVKHHLDADISLQNYDQSQVVLPSRPDLDAIDFIVMNNPQRIQPIAEANELATIRLNNLQFKSLIDFLHALTDPAAMDIRKNTPSRVPSDLPVYD
ncbi:MAG: cytochrome c peroxidase [Methylococcales bacterium]